MQQSYLALLRGINVGGKSLIKMADLKTALERQGLQNVSTYIQSGNVFFTSMNTDKTQLAQLINKIIRDAFMHEVEVVIFTKPEWEMIISNAPEWWGHKSEWKHNLLVLLPPATAEKAIEAIGTLKPDIEAVEAGPGVVYQGISLELFGKTTSGKLASSPIYKKMTVRNYNTSTKLLTLFS
jgi:uncharacterized protein (DUF1697 family)